MDAAVTARIRPVYVDGPLAGQEFPAAGPVVYAIDPDAPSGSPPVAYQLRQIGFHCGGTAVALWIASVHDEPDAATIAEHILSEQAKRARAILPGPLRPASREERKA